jgi:hypothetical protein
MSYSLDGQSWTTLTAEVSASITTPTIHAGEKVYWKGENGALGKRTDARLCPFSSTGKYNISGDVRSIIDPSTMGGTQLGGNRNGYILHSVFANNKIVDASGLLLPPCNRSQSYSYMFSGCTDMVYPPAVLACTSNNTTRWSDGVFQGCTSLVRSPLLTLTDVISYGYNLLFDGCSSLKYVQCFAVNLAATNSLSNWMRNTPNTTDGVFVKHIDATWTTTGNSGVPTNWTIIYYDPSDDKYYTSQDKSQECDDHGNII